MPLVSFKMSVEINPGTIKIAEIATIQGQAFRTPFERRIMLGIPNTVRSPVTNPAKATDNPVPEYLYLVGKLSVIRT